MIATVVWMLMVGSPLLIWALFRRGGYKRRPLDAPPGPDWRPTGESFVDPTSGQLLEVWQSPDSGERAYVRTRASKGAPRDR